MNGLDFTSSLVGHLAWPALAAVTVIIFRKPLSALIGRLRSYEGMGQKVTFGQGLAQAEQSVEPAAEDAKTDATPEPVEPQPEVAQDSQVNPSFTILKSWERLSEAIIDLQLTVTGDRTGTFRNSGLTGLRSLQEGGYVSQSFVEAVGELRALRNSVAHGQQIPTPGEAVAYASSAEELGLVARMTAQRELNAAQEKLAHQSLRAQYDATAPRVSIALRGDVLTRTIAFESDRTRGVNDLKFIEEEDLDSYWVQVHVIIDTKNAGDSVVSVTNTEQTSGEILSRFEEPQPRVWQLHPGDGTVLMWSYRGTARNLLNVMGVKPLFGVRLLFEVTDNIGTVVDAHHLEFQFIAIERDGSRAKFPPNPIRVSSRTHDGHDTGGIAVVERGYPSL